jgi:acetyl/propionyl-CoA carboxylase alpha subunit
LINVLEHPAFVAGEVHTGFVEEHLGALLRTREASELVAAAAAFTRESGASPASSGSPTTADPWRDLRGWGR